MNTIHGQKANGQWKQVIQTDETKISIFGIVMLKYWRRQLASGKKYIQATFKRQQRML